MINVGLVSLGCPKNLVDSERMLGLLSSGGYQITTRLDSADIIIVNTCAFLESARRESRAAIRKVAGYKKKSCRLLVVAGCLVQYWSRKAPRHIPEANLLIGVGEYRNLPRLLKKLLSGSSISVLSYRAEPVFTFPSNAPRVISTPPHYAYLRIADGCNNRCRYCLVPKLRGRYRARKLPDLVTEVRELVRRGVKEVIIVAQDTSYYGLHTGGKSALPHLLESLAAIEHLKWIRILYTHPAHLDRRTLKTIASGGKICSYLDIPIQHINSRILERMGRNITRARIIALLDLARELIPGISLRTTLMVGFPGEGEQEFQELFEFVRGQRFDHLGVFAYSPEKGTPAMRYWRRVNPDTALKRRAKLMRLQKSISSGHLKQYQGQIVPVFIDGPFPSKGSDLMIGHAWFQAPEIDGLVVVEGSGKRRGELVDVRITDSSAYDLYGVRVQ